MTHFWEATWHRVVGSLSIMLILILLHGTFHYPKLDCLFPYITKTKQANKQNLWGKRWCYLLWLKYLISSQHIGNFLAQNMFWSYILWENQLNKACTQKLFGKKNSGIPWGPSGLNIQHCHCCGSGHCCGGFNPWPRNFCMQRACPPPAPPIPQPKYTHSPKSF